MTSESQSGEIVQSPRNAPVVIGTGVPLAERIDYRQFERAVDVQQFLEDFGVATLDGSEEFGDGFVLLEDKDSLVKVPFLITEFQFNPGEFGGDYIALRVIRFDNNERYVIIDGSTGIKEQVARYIAHATGGQYKVGQTYVQPILCKSGLRRSDYDYTDEKGKVTPASTFYIA